jgi:hypothetical protein
MRAIKSGPTTALKAVALDETSVTTLVSKRVGRVELRIKTDYRGPIAIVSLSEGGRAVAIGRLTSVRPNGDRFYVWEFRDVAEIEAFPTTVRRGVFNLSLPNSLFPKTTDPACATEGKRDAWVKVQIADDLRTARTSLMRAAAGMRRLSSEKDTEEQFDHQRITAILGALQMGAEQLTSTMILADATWKRQLASWTEEEPEIPVDDADHRKGGEPSSLRLDVLVVDDEPKTARGLQRSLSGVHNVRIAISKQEAIDQITQKVPDVLLCDYRIEWESAEDLLQMVRDRYPTVRRVLYSFSRIEVWCDLVNRRLVDTAIPKSAPKAQILAALT